MTDRFAQAKQLADAVLYEGYVLYPYRSTSKKNQVRWQFGVLAPRAWVEGGGCEHAWLRAEVLVESGPSGFTGKVRFLQLSRRTIEDLEGRPRASLEVDGQLWTAWDEGVEREIDISGPLASHTVEFALPAHQEVEALTTKAGRVVGRVLREQWPLSGTVTIDVETLQAMSPLARVKIRVDNTTPCDPSLDRDQALRSALVGVHTLLALDSGAFISLVDPPEWATPAATACANLRTWPVLVGPEGGDNRVLLASPIILADHTMIADESPGDLYDGCEIDEILTLRTMTLTEDEKREARATDPRAAAIIDRVDSMSADTLGRMHGAMRSPRPEAPVVPGKAPEVPWWDPGADQSVNPETDTVEVAGVPLARGARVKLAPGKRRSDAHDMFLIGRVATVQGVYIDVEEQRYLAVTLDDDPNADLHDKQGRYYYFYPDEVEPMTAGARP